MGRKKRTKSMMDLVNESVFFPEEFMAANKDFVARVAKMGIRVVSRENPLYPPEPGESTPDPFRHAIESNMDVTHTFDTSHAKLIGYSMLPWLFLRRRGVFSWYTIASWCELGQPLNKNWGLHESIAKATIEWLKKYGIDACPDWSEDWERDEDAPART
jgi:hypothetical protein